MARAKMVTRTFITTKAKVLCLNTDTATPEIVEVTLPRTYKNDGEVLKAAKPLIETEVLKAVKVTETATEETLYGMDEAEFIKNAQILPPRTAVEATEVEATTEETAEN